MRLTWGIPFPFDPDYVTYVWVDALVSYLSVIGYGTDRFANFWPANGHLIGKDILTPHAIYWPTMLHALGISMPERILAHGWMLMGREKMSKSIGNVVSPQDYISRFGADALRYFICRELQWANDTDFTEERFLQRFNADLANDLGNLANRSLSMIYRYCNGIVPELGGTTSADDDLRKVTISAFDVYHKEMNAFAYGAALEAIWQLVSRANRYVEENAPWKLARDASRKERLETVLHLLAETVAVLSYLISPFMPETAQKMAAQLGTNHLPEAQLQLLNVLPAGHVVGQVSPLFPRHEKEQK